MQDIIAIGAFVVTTWALAITGLAMVSKSEYATKLTKEAAAFAILTFSIFGILATAAVAGYRTFNTPSGALWTGWLFLAPFMVALVYAASRRKNLSDTERNEESKPVWTWAILFLWVASAVALLCFARLIDELPFFVKMG